MGRVNPIVGVYLRHRPRRRPLLTLTDDTSGCVHDTPLAACDIYRLRAARRPPEPHDNCTDNLHAALDFSVPCTPSPLNLFENARPAPDGTLVIAPPVSTPGQPCDACAPSSEITPRPVPPAPQDMAPTNGPPGSDRCALP